MSYDTNVKGGNGEMSHKSQESTESEHHHKEYGWFERNGLVIVRKAKDI